MSEEASSVARQEVLSHLPVTRSPAAVMGSRALRRRAHILETARRLFVERGYAATSIDGIAQEAAISRASVYTYFPSKRDILRTIAVENTPIYVERVRELAEAMGSRERHRRIRAAVENYIDYLEHSFAFVLVWDQSAIQDEPLRDEGVRLMRTMWRELGLAVQAARGTVSHPPELEGAAVLSMLERMWFFHDMLRAHFESDELVDALAEGVERLIRPGRRGS